MFSRAASGRRQKNILTDILSEKLLFQRIVYIVGGHQSLSSLFLLYDKKTTTVY